jgi:uncharacterized protein (TIGR03000 family)
MVLMMAVSAAPDAAACHKTYGCTGCTGCTGAVVVSNGCCGGSCHGGCHGGGLFGGGCHGGGLFSGGLFHRSHGCSGCTGCTGYSCTGGCTGCTGVAPVETAPVAPKKEMPSEPKKGGVTSLPAPSLITVNVPADAKVFVDGSVTVSTSTVRVFSTPELRPGAVYYYTFSAEVVRNGKSFTATERVAVETGSNPTITLDPLSAPSVASK